MTIDALRVMIICMLLVAGVLSITGCFPTVSRGPSSAAPIHTRVYTLVCADPTGRRLPKPLGTAFFINDRGDIITAAHLIRSAIPFYVRRHEQCVPAVDLFGTIVDVTRCTADHYDVVDCSLVRNPFGILYLPENLTVLELTLPQQRIGTPVEVIGYLLQRPQDPAVVTFGGIVGYNGLPDWNVAPDVVVEAHGEPGMSGGPILAPDGTVLGIIIDVNPCARTPGMVCDDVIGRPSSSFQFVINARKYPWRRLITTKT